MRPTEDNKHRQDDKRKNTGSNKYWNRQTSRQTNIKADKHRGRKHWSSNASGQMNNRQTNIRAAKRRGGRKLEVKTSGRTNIGRKNIMRTHIEENKHRRWQRTSSQTSMQTKIGADKHWSGQTSRQTNIKADKTWSGQTSRWPDIGRSNIETEIHQWEQSSGWKNIGRTNIWRTNIDENKHGRKSIEANEQQGRQTSMWKKIGHTNIEKYKHRRVQTLRSQKSMQTNIGAEKHWCGQT